MDAIALVATVPAVIALVTLAKDLGLPSKLSPLLAVVLGVALSLFSAAALGGITNFYEPIALGLILGLSASGLYDGAKAIGSGASVVVEEDPATKPLLRRDLNS